MTTMAASYYQSAFKLSNRDYDLAQRPPSPIPPAIEPLSPLRPIEPTFNYPPTTVYHWPPNDFSTSQHPLHDHYSGPRQRTASQTIDDLAEIALATSQNLPTSRSRPPLDSFSARHQSLSGPPSHHEDLRQAKRIRSDAGQYPSPYTAHPATHMSHVGSPTWPTFDYHRQSFHRRESPTADLEDAALLLNFATRVSPFSGATHDTQASHTWPAHLPSPKESDGQQPYQNYQHQYVQLETPPAEVPVGIPTQYPHNAANRARPVKKPARATAKSEAASKLGPDGKPTTRRGWPKGKPRGPKIPRKSLVPPKKRNTRGAQSQPPIPELAIDTFHKPTAPRRHSHAAASSSIIATSRPSSLPPDFTLSQPKPTLLPKPVKAKVETTCVGCRVVRRSVMGEVEQWIGCNGCNEWFHSDCAGFAKEKDVRVVDKFFCKTCEPVHGPTTFVRKSGRAHTSVNYAGLNQGVLTTSDDCHEHHYIQPIKDGAFTFDPETFPRIRPELVTADFFEKMSNFTEPFLISAEFNKHPARRADHYQQLTATDDDDVCPEAFGYESAPYDGQDKLDMVIPQDLTVRQVCDLVGPDYPLEVIDVKVQGTEGGKWNLGRWADYYEAPGEKPIRNVISLEVSDTKLGRLLRRPKVVRDLDLQDDVWPTDNLADPPKSVAFYCLMSIQDSYTDFHIDFGGTSVYYHILRGKKTFFFIPPKPKHLKAYEEWNNSHEQNFTFLPHITKECYRVDLSQGDTMLIPSGWIHAVWTPENSLVIGGNFLTRLHFSMQFRICDIERANKTPLRFRYPKFQKVMWYTVLKYLETDPLPNVVRESFHAGQQFARETPTWQQLDDEPAEPGDALFHARYYSQMELDGMPELVAFIFRTVMIMLGRIEGVSDERRKFVARSMPKLGSDPLEIAKTFALWVAWKRGNEDPPTWAHADAVLPEKGAVVDQRLSSRGMKLLQRQGAMEATKAVSDRHTRRKQQQAAAKLQVEAEVKADVDDALVGKPASEPQPSNSPKHSGSSGDDPTCCTLDAVMVDRSGVTLPASIECPAPNHSGWQDIEVTEDTGTKRRGKACIDCRKNKRRCMHDEWGRVDPSKQPAKAKKRKPEISGSPRAVKDEPDLLDVDAERVEADAGRERQRHGESASSTDTARPDKTNYSVDSGVSMAAPSATMPIEASTPKSRHTARHAKPVDRLLSSSSGTSTPQLKSPVSNKKRRAAAAEVLSPRAKKTKTDGAASDLCGVISSPPVDEEEESLRLARELAGESFGLRRRKSVGL